MSISRSGSSGELHYDDLEKQRLSVETEWDPGGADPAADLNERFPGLVTFEPAQGLDRGEVAELVGYEVEVTSWIRGTNTDEAQFVNHWELSTRSQPLYPGLLTNSFQGINSFDGTSEDGTTTDFDTATGAPNEAILDEDVIWHVRTTGDSGGFDTATGTGAGSDGVSSNDRTSMWYRDHVDSGPTYDRHNELELHHLTSIIDNNHKLRCGLIGDLYWNVYEE